MGTWQAPKGAGVKNNSNNSNNNIPGRALGSRWAQTRCWPEDKLEGAELAGPLN